MKREQEKKKRVEKKIKQNQKNRKNKGRVSLMIKQENNP